MDLARDFAAAQESISQALVGATRAVARVSAEDVSFHRSLDPDVGTEADRQSSRLLALSQRLLQRATSSTGSSRIELTDAESIDNNWRAVVDAADTLFERADTCLDEFTGLVKQATPREDAGSPASGGRQPRPKNTYRTTNLPKPQLLFDTKPLNHETEPFKPFLRSKPHASVLLEKSLFLRRNEENRPQYLHPYATEISAYEYPSFVYTKSEPMAYTPFESTTATFVEDLDAVHTMLEELRKAPVVAIDLEHHDSHSYAGIVSLMQISTRDRDWIVDTLKPWRRKLEVLNEVFADPNILKVLHGAQMDTIWLQRDLGLYLVGLFDTYHAARRLGYPGASLAYLLKRFVNFDAQKQYQTADWRVRPLPGEMFDYARSDTHFLLYVFDNMRNELVERSKFDNYDQNKVQAVLERSKETALQRYEYPVYDVNSGLGPNGWFNSLRNTSMIFSKEQFSVYRKVHEWRDIVARQEDESPQQIMPKQVLMGIAQVLPREVPALLNTSHNVSQYVRSRASELLDVIKAAIAEGADGPEMHETMTRISKELGLYVPRRGDVVAAALAEAQSTTSSPAQLASAENHDVRSIISSMWGPTLPQQASAQLKRPNLPFMISVTPSVPARIISSFPTSTADTVDLGAEEIKPTQGGGTMEYPQPGLDSPSRPTKRKQSDLVAEDADFSQQQDSVSIPASATSDRSGLSVEGMRKMQQKAEKRAAKQAKRDSMHASSPVTNGAGERETFDYSTAPSILHAVNGSSSGGAKGKRDKKKPFDPYKKALDAKGPIQQQHRPKAGKSATFKK